MNQGESDLAHTGTIMDAVQLELRSKPAASLG